MIRSPRMLAITLAALGAAGCSHARGGARPASAPDYQALAEWACTAPPQALEDGQEVRRAGVRFRVPEGMVQQLPTTANPYEWAVMYTSGPRVVGVRLSSRGSFVGDLTGARCRINVAGREAQARIYQDRSNIARYTLVMKWRSVYPGTDLIFTAGAPDRESLDELRKVAWTFTLPRDRDARRTASSPGGLRDEVRDAGAKQ